jgi:hypothetical protein
VAKYGTLVEIESEWSFEDCLDAHDILNEIEDAQRDLK